MDEIRRQVSRAQRRMIFQQFVGVATWATFALLLVLVAALAVPKIWVLPIDATSWTYTWIAAVATASLLLAVVWTYCIGRRRIDAAVEIDRRFGLKERISSTLSLSQRERSSQAGQALIDDAGRRVARIDVRDRFGLVLRWQLLLPLLPAAVVLLVLLLPNASSDSTAQGNETSIIAQQQIKNSTEQLRKRLEEERLRAEENDLEEARILFDTLQSELDKLNSRDNVDRRDAMIKLNDLKKKLQDRKKQLGGADQMRRQLNQLKDFKKGPADKLAKALRDGNFQDAVDQLQQLQQQLENDQLDDDQKQQLADQLQQMQKKLEQMVEAHQQAKRDLQQKIDQLRQDGDLAQANKLQQKLDQLEMQDQQMNRIEQMADGLGQCQKCLQGGDGQGAAGQLGDLAGQLQQMQQDFDNLEAIDGQLIDDLMAQIDQAKDAMNCQQCQGAGCQACQGNGLGQGDQPGNGLGQGQGRGARPEEETDSGYFDSQVRGNVQPGEAVIAGTAGGPNVKGLSQQSAREQVTSSLNNAPDPLVNKKLTRSQREHARQYFERFREGSD